MSQITVFPQLTFGAIFQNGRQIFNNIHIRPVFEDTSCYKKHFFGFHGREIDCNENEYRVGMSRSPYDHQFSSYYWKILI